MDGSKIGMDEASICGITHCAMVNEADDIQEFIIDPKKLGLAAQSGSDLTPAQDVQTESKRFAALMANKEDNARKDAVILNAGLIFLAANKAKDVEDGIQMAARILESGTAFKTLETWVQTQTTDPEKSLGLLHGLMD